MTSRVLIDDNHNWLPTKNGGEEEFINSRRSVTAPPVHYAHYNRVTVLYTQFKYPTNKQLYTDALRNFSNDSVARKVQILQQTAVRSSVSRPLVLVMFVLHTAH
jgi:hypothetical protein